MVRENDSQFERDLFTGIAVWRDDGGIDYRCSVCKNLRDSSEFGSDDPLVCEDCLNLNLCARCRIAAAPVGDGFHTPMAHGLFDATGTDCAWSRLNADQRAYVSQKGVSPSDYCGRASRMTERKLREDGLFFDDADGGGDVSSDNAGW